MEFREGLFNEEWPELVLEGVGKDWATGGEAGKIVVYGNNDPFSIFTELQPVKPLLVDVLRDKESLKKNLPLREYLERDE